MHRSTLPTLDTGVDEVAEERPLLDAVTIDVGADRHSGRLGHGADDDDFPHAIPPVLVSSVQLGPQPDLPLRIGIPGSSTSGSTHPEAKDAHRREQSKP